MQCTIVCPSVYEIFKIIQLLEIVLVPPKSFTLRAVLSRSQKFTEGIITVTIYQSLPELITKALLNDSLVPLPIYRGQEHLIILVTEGSYFAFEASSASERGTSCRSARTSLYV